MVLIDLKLRLVVWRDLNFFFLMIRFLLIIFCFGRRENDIKFLFLRIELFFFVIENFRLKCFEFERKIRLINRLLMLEK